SLGSKSDYEIEINVTGYTYYFAYSWYNTLDNNTKEELDRKDAAPGHQMWTEEGSQYPNFVDVEGASPREEAAPRSENEEFYAPLGANVTISYDTIDPINSTSITLSLANSTGDLYNETLSQRYVMEQFTYAEEDTGGLLISSFKFNYTVTQRLVYFTAFNDYGWEQIIDNEPISHSITTGFDFNVTFSENLNQYTDLDPIVFNVTIVNATDDDSFQYRYRYYENDTAEEPISDWTEFTFTNIIISNEERNKTIDNVNFTQTLSIYNGVIDMNFNVSNLVQVQVFVDYFGNSYNATVPNEVNEIIIKDSRPELNLLTNNETITNLGSGFIDWEQSTLRGSIVNVTISSDTTDLSNEIITNSENFTISFTDSGDNIIESNHEITILAFNSFEVVNVSDPNQARYTVFASRFVTAIYTVDTTAPAPVFISNSTNSMGKLTVSFNWIDLGLNPTGIAFASLSWGNGIVIEVTSLTEASHTYRISGIYTITLNVTDNAGNFAVLTGEIEITVPTTKEANKRDSPLSLFAIFTAFVLLSIAMRFTRKRKSNL
ncbi:MAG: PKD domain-containing protein, partial [Candidatus Kariarchaeaceae archaeon]